MSGTSYPWSNIWPPRQRTYIDQATLWVEMDKEDYIKIDPRTRVPTDFSFSKGEPEGGQEIRLKDMLDEAFEYGLGVASLGLPVSPFVLTRGEVVSGVVNMAKHVLKTYSGLPVEKALERAKHDAMSQADKVEMVAVGCHGTVELDNRNRDSVIVVAGVRGQQSAMRYSQAYRKKSFFRPFKILTGQVRGLEEETLFK